VPSRSVDGVTTAHLLADRGTLRAAELPIISFILNTDCDARQLKAPSESPGVCRFCNRERNLVETDRTTVLRVQDELRAETSAGRVVFTGGDLLMPYDHFEPAIERASQLRRAGRRAQQRPRGAGAPRAVRARQQFLPSSRQEAHAHA
jgi:hypothetical protein